MTERLDIVVPYWGDPNLLRDTVASVAAQDDPRWTLTVVDDDYPGDAAREIVEGVADERVRYVRNERNLGIIDNFRRCVSLATGVRTVLLGCDDLLHPSYVATVLAGHERHPAATIIQPGVEVIGADGQPRRTLVDRVKEHLSGARRRTGDQLLDGEAAATSLIRGNWLYWPSLAIRTEDLQATDFRDDWTINLDLALVLDLLVAGGSILVVPETCFSYRRHDASLSSNTIADGMRFAQDRDFYRHVRLQMRCAGWLRAARAARVRATSRAHAIALLPGAMLRLDGRTIRQLLVHAVG